MRRTILLWGLTGALGLPGCALDTTGTGNTVGNGDTGGTGGTGGGAVGGGSGGTGGAILAGGGTPTGGTGAAPASGGGTATGGSGTGGGSTGGGGTGGSSACGNDVIDPGESCDGGEEPAGSGCTDCIVDAAVLAIVDQLSLQGADGLRHYYYINQSAEVFDGAQATCQDIRANLVNISSDDEQAAVATLGASLGSYWIGARNPADVPPTLNWITNESDTPYEPDSGIVLNAQDERCVAVEVAPVGTVGANGWHDKDCSERLPSICEWVVPGALPE